MRVPVTFSDEAPEVQDLTLKVKRPQSRAQPANLPAPIPAPPPEPPPAEPEPRLASPQPGTSKEGAGLSQSPMEHPRGRRRARVDSESEGLPEPKRSSAESTNKTERRQTRASQRKRERSMERNTDERAPVRTKPEQPGYKLPAWYTLADEDTDMSDPSDLSDTGNVNQISPIVTVNITPNSLIPTRGTEGSAGWDCRANQSVTLEPGRPTKVDLGMRAAIPADWCLLLHSRSKLASEGITVEAGVIDSDFRGSIVALLYNHNHTARRIHKGKPIAQALFIPVPTINWQVTSLNETDYGDCGFGHTDKS